MTILREPTNPYIDTPAYAVEKHIQELTSVFLKNGSESDFEKAYALLTQLSELRGNLNDNS